MGGRSLVWVAVLLIILLVLLGSGISINIGEPQLNEGPVEEINSFGTQQSNTDTKGQSITTKSSQTPTKTPEQSKEIARISTQEKERLEPLIASFYEKLDTADQSRRQVTLDVATEICTKSKAINDVSESSARVASSENMLRRLKFGVEIIRENFNSKLSPKTLEDLQSTTQSLTKFTPLIGSFNQMREDACAVSKDPSGEAIEDFYISTAAFGVEVGMVQYGFYETAFSGTRKVVNSAGLAKMRSLCGDRCYALAMSEIHWAIRGAPIGATEFIREKARESKISFNITGETSEYVIDEQGLQYAKQTIVSCAAYAGEDAVSIGNDVVEDGGEAVDADGNGEHDIDDIQSGAENLFNAAKNTSFSDIENGSEEVASITVESVSELDPGRIHDKAGEYLRNCSE